MGDAGGGATYVAFQHPGFATALDQAVPMLSIGAGFRARGRY
ncbi:hypothetical protein [Streptomyces sp. NPDC047525]